jgi:hypothetical protein
MVLLLFDIYMKNHVLVSMVQAAFAAPSASSSSTAARVQRAKQPRAQSRLS